MNLSIARSSRVRFWLLAVVVVILVVLSVHRTLRPGAQDGDFGAYYRAGVTVSEGGSPYFADPRHFAHYFYAPVFAHALFRPLARLPYLWAARVFMLLNWIAAAALLLLCIHIVRDLYGPHLDVFAVAALALMSSGMYLWYNLHSGQVGIMLALACVAFVWLSLVGRPFIGGLVLAFAVGLKLYPVLLAPLLLLRRDGWGVAGLACGLLVLFLAPALFVGFGAIVPLHLEWIEFSFQGQTSGQTIRYGNQSVLALLARLPWISDGHDVLSASNLAALVRVYPVIALTVAGAAYAFIMVQGRKAVMEQHRWLAHSSLLFILMTILMPRTWKVNFAIMLLPAMLMAAALVQSRAPRWIAPTALLAVLAAITVPTPGAGVVPYFLDFIIQSKHLIAAAILAFAVIALRSPAPEERPIPTPAAASRVP